MFPENYFMMKENNYRRRMNPLFDDDWIKLYNVKKDTNFVNITTQENERARNDGRDKSECGRKN